MGIVCMVSAFGIGFGITHHLRSLGCPNWFGNYQIVWCLNPSAKIYSQALAQCYFWFHLICLQHQECADSATYLLCIKIALRPLKEFVEF